jgi:hypothetical protein
MYNRTWRAGRVIAGPGHRTASSEASCDRGREESPDTVLSRSGKGQRAW